MALLSLETETVYLCQEKNQIFFQESCYNTVVSFADVSPFVLILFINLGYCKRISYLK